MKKIISSRLNANVLEYLNHIAEINNISRSKAIELAVSLVQDCFSDNQICLEHISRGSVDGRTRTTTSDS